MTEEEWLNCTDPQPMLEFLEGRASDRKLRLFAVACCRRIWHLLTDERSRRAVETAERFAEGQANRQELAASCAAADMAHFEAPRNSNFRSLDAPPNAAEIDLSCAAADAAACTADAIEIAAKGDKSAKEQECQHQATILGCIIGNPFHPVTLDLSWLTPTVKALAQTIYTDRTFDQMPLLADELEKAGCANQEILAHFRGPGPHVRGCCVVDMVLGKE